MHQHATQFECKLKSAEVAESKSSQQRTIHLVSAKSITSNPSTTVDHRPVYEHFSVHGGLNLENKEYQVSMKRCTLCKTEMKVWHPHPVNGCRNSLLEAIRSF